MKSFFKYMGGKSREIPTISTMLPNNIDRVIEPFSGSAVVSFHLEKPAVISDINSDVINLFKVVKDKFMFYQLNDLISFHLKKGASEEEYYKQRNILNNKQESNEVIKAFSFLYIRQLCFSGMHRISNNGDFNVPFGWYPNFFTPLNINYHNLLQTWEINLCSFENTLINSKSGDFIFLDPPYYERNSDYGGGHDMGTSEELHISLFNLLDKITYPWMVVHVDCDLYRQLYKNYDIFSKNFTYSMNFKGRKSSTNKVAHLYIRNYSLSKPLF